MENGKLNASDAILQLLEQRGRGKSICPSEAARRIAIPAQAWRAAMQDVHKSAAALQNCGKVTISWKGMARAVGDGPYRIALTKKDYE